MTRWKAGSRNWKRRFCPSRPAKVVTIRCCRDEDMDAARDRHFAAHPEDRDATLVVFLRKMLTGD